MGGVNLFGVHRYFKVLSREKVMLQRLMFVITVLVFGALSWGAQWEIPSQGVQELQVRAKAAKVTLQKSEGAVIRIQVTGPKEAQWQQELQNSVLKLTGPEEGLSTEDTVVVIELPTGSVSSKIVFDEVRAELQSVSRVSVTAIKGRIIGRLTGDNVKLSLQKGEIQSFQHAGALEIENFGGKVTITEGQGSLKVRLFSGDLVIEKNVGSLNLESYASSAKMSGQQGLLSLQWGKGNLSLSDFSGRLEGVSNDGQLQLQIKPETLIDLQANKGRVNVTLPQDSGAQLNVRSGTGEVVVPGPLKASREGRFRVARGKLVGSVKGSVTVRAEDASVYVK